MAQSGGASLRKRVWLSRPDPSVSSLPGSVRRAESACAKISICFRMSRSWEEWSEVCSSSRMREGWHVLLGPALSPISWLSRFVLPLHSHRSSHCQRLAKQRCATRPPLMSSVCSAVEP